MMEEEEVCVKVLKFSHCLSLKFKEETFLYIKRGGRDGYHLGKRM